jgi:phosphocarrier protein
MEMTVKVQNEEGMHARPAGVLVKQAMEFKSNIQLSYQGMTKSAKSLMGVMSLGLPHGAEVTIKADGEDEAVALQKITALFDSKFQVQA